MKRTKPTVHVSELDGEVTIGLGKEEALTLMTVLSHVSVRSFTYGNRDIWPLWNALYDAGIRVDHTKDRFDSIEDRPDNHLIRLKNFPDE